MERVDASDLLARDPSEAGGGRAGPGGPFGTAPNRPRVLLLGLDCPGDDRSGFSTEESLDELGLLVDTWGGEAVARLVQARAKPDPAWYVGRGKLEEAAGLIRATGAGVVVADSELSPVQLRNLEAEFERSGLDVRVIDRTQVILEIFARRAHSREGKLQVDLAQAVYALPRLTGKGLVLSRLGGGIGTRGPGETKLEMDRRRLRERITELKREMAQISRQRVVQARSRREAGTPLATLVGYTNAGKSTLFNRLAGTDVLVEDKLFATLDPVVRRIELPGNQRALLSDTVGFIRKLPHHLVAAFRATLEEVRWADVLLHVVDASNPSWPEQARAAANVLRDVVAQTESTEGAGAPVVYVLNKTDRLPGGRQKVLADPVAQQLAREHRVVALSAATGEGVPDLLTALAAELAGRRRVFALKVPYGQAAVLSRLHEQGRVLTQDYEADGVKVEVELDRVAGLRFLAALRQAGPDGEDGREAPPGEGGRLKPEGGQEAGSEAAAWRQLKGTREGREEED